MSDQRRCHEHREGQRGFATPWSTATVAASIELISTDSSRLSRATASSSAGSDGDTGFTKRPIVKYKILDRFPATQEGWIDCWSHDSAEISQSGCRSIAAGATRGKLIGMALIAEATYAEELRSLDASEVIGSIACCSEDTATERRWKPGARMDLYFTAEGLWATF